MRTFKIAICEDDRDQNEHLNYMIKKSCIFLSSEHQKFEISNTFYSYESIFQFINSSSKLPDIYFLDIQLSSKPDDKNGIELANLIRNRQKTAQIIFITTHDELALLTFEYQIEALDYIVKGNEEAKIQTKITQDLEKSAYKLEEFLEKKNNIFTYQIGNNFYRVNIDDIYYISTTPFPHRLKIIAKNEISEFTGDIKNIQDKIPSFIKVSQSYLVNMKNITSINLKKRLILFPTGEEIQFAFSAKRKIKEYLMAD